MARTIAVIELLSGHNVEIPPVRRFPACRCQGGASSFDQLVSTRFVRCRLRRDGADFLSTAEGWREWILGSAFREAYRTDAYGLFTMTGNPVGGDRTGSPLQQELSSTD